MLKYSGWSKIDVLRVYNFLKFLRNSGTSVDEFMLYAKGLEETYLMQQTVNEAINILRAYEWENFAMKCPSCGNPMAIMDVNTSPRNQVPGKWKGVWTCNNKDCMEQIWLKFPAYKKIDSFGKMFSAKYSGMSEKQLIEKAEKIKNKGE